MTKPLKSATTVAEQIDLLTARGMRVDADLAEQWLVNVGYYRLSAYWHPARLVDDEGRRTDRFRDGISFEDAAHLYEADRKLRALVPDGMERIEIALRTRLGEQTYDRGPLGYLDPTRFRPSFDHARWVATTRRRIDRAERRSESIQHYKSEYGAFPFWVLAEALDFADVSRLYEGLPSKDQQHIAEGFGIRIALGRLTRSQRDKVRKQSPLVRWMEQFTVIRNTCAHHGRLWNKRFIPAPTPAMRTQSELSALPAGQSEKLYGALVVMAHLLRNTSPGTSWPDKVASLLRQDFLPNPLVYPDGLGLPEDWPHSL